jgi:hypothetical protein
MKKAFLFVPVIAAAALGGCASDNDMGMHWMDTKTIVGGALLGAAVGTGLGVGVAAIASTNLWTGALVGASVGGGLGAVGGAVAQQPVY